MSYWLHLKEKHSQPNQNFLMQEFGSTMPWVLPLWCAIDITKVYFGSVHLLRCFILILFVVLVLILDCTCQQSHHLFHAVTRSLPTSIILLRENYSMALEGRYYSR